ncbi:MAG: sporulation protein YabP [Thermanaeromonas sp.]|uniref:sporulation protein YabP n=1 Tax=Thermanaeromonas sp. TaxID=2003697 RepID=UPI00243D2DB5|nr:sporulation protein YabP [Thermanaeromonas sp.]MCG0277881.1 sporulation protein YabP [Thermanaeromonas sp.]
MGEGQHRVEVTDRQNISVSGVVQVMGYDEEEIILETTRGILVLKGKNFNISSLSLENGTLEASGFLNSLDYREEGAAKKSFLRRILK